ncbi:pyridoxal phosphate-dependent aminotransferase [Bengtsoniella intestinalis]|uniref:pyridoxal phosphate-dependent aminotransferase n=1 Tax=Bengtsoniella intestinalis TaxID=3073143 RepID=UPI00391FC9BA
MANFSENVLEYAYSAGVNEYLTAVVDYYGSLGIKLSNKEVLSTVGGSEALQIVMNCILDVGDEILIPEPFYPNYNTFVSIANADIVPVPTTPEEGYFYAEKSRFEAKITPKTRAILISNPGNPTGVVLTPEQMRVMADIAKEHDLWLISDEVYREFVYGGEDLATMLVYEDIADRLIIIDSISKRFSACGARVGAIISRNQAFMAQALKLCQGRLSNATLEQVGAAALYAMDGDYFTAVREEYKKRRDTVMAGLGNIPGAVCQCPGGAFYIMASLPIDDANKFLIWLLEEFEDNNETVMFAPGASFYATEGKGTNEIRIAYILNCQDLARSMELLGLAVAQYNQQQGV